eukprot:1620548-Prymnesium_polylepis.1
MRDVCRRGLPGHGDGGDDHGLMRVGAGVAAGRVDGDALDLDFSGGGGHFLSKFARRVHTHTSATARRNRPPRHKSYRT